MDKRKARPCERWPKILKGELENNFTKPRDLVGITGIVTAYTRVNLLFLGKQA
jgi:hypothetical protein